MAIEVRKRSRIPHWHARSATYFVTWNLADAMPLAARRRIEDEKNALLLELERRTGTPTHAEKWAIEQWIRERVDALLDAGHGGCLLRVADAATLVEQSILYFDDVRYRLLSYCVMPNHVHVVLELIGDSSIDAVVKSWKSYTALLANRILKREGAFWQADYFDRLIRGEGHLVRTMEYVERNPVVAGLQDWKWVRAYWDRIV